MNEGEAVTGENKILSDRAEQVLAAAQELFLQHGYQGTSLQMLIDKAGGSRRTIYAEFGNKQQLFQAVVLAKVADLRAKLADFPQDETPEVVLKSVCRAFLQTMMLPQNLAMFRLVISNITHMPELGEEIYRAGPMIATQPLARYLSELKKRGLVDILDTQKASHSLLGMLKEPMHIRAILQPDYRPTDADIEQQVEYAVGVFLKAVLK